MLRKLLASDTREHALNDRTYLQTACCPMFRYTILRDAPLLGLTSCVRTDDFVWKVKAFIKR